MKNQVFNPYLPSWEYIPDGEPHIFGDRVYIFGSHDIAHGWVFCLGDYVCYSAPITDLSDWKYEGIIYSRLSDPLNKDGKMCLYAPDVTKGPDGKYYLYYVLDKTSVISVATSNTPEGKYEFYGYVHYKDGTRLGEKHGDEPQFDPGVLTENGNTYLYGGFCSCGDKSRTGAKVTVLDKDMLTIIKNPETIVPSCEYSDSEKWKEFRGHEYFEAASIRKFNDTYYFIYSSIVMHELCYATSNSPLGEFRYGGVIVSNCDLHISSYKHAEMPSAYGANNHGSIEKIGNEFYVFYHRQTNGKWFSRQGCAEKIQILKNNTIPQVEITSNGLNGKPLISKGKYSASIACNLFTDKPNMYVGENQPRITTDGRDGDKSPSYIANITKNTTIGFKYFDIKDVTKFCITTRGYGKGIFEVRTKWNGECFCKIQIDFTNFWTEYSSDISLPSGKQSIYLVYKGDGTCSLLNFEFK